MKPCEGEAKRVPHTIRALPVPGRPRETLGAASNTHVRPRFRVRTTSVPRPGAVPRQNASSLETKVIEAALKSAGAAGRDGCAVADELPEELTTGLAEGGAVVAGVVGV